MTSPIDPGSIRRERNRKLRDLLDLFYEKVKGKCKEIVTFENPIEGETRELFNELMHDGFINNASPDPIAGKQVYYLTREGREEVERVFPSYSETHTLNIDADIFLNKFTNLENYHIKTLEDLREFEKTYKSLEQGIRDLKEQLTDISMKMDTSDMRKEIDSLLVALDPTHITSSLIHLYRLWQNPKSEPLRRFLAKKVPLLENTMETMPVKGLM